MNLIPNARILWHRLWSMRFAIAAAAFSAAAGAWAIMPVDWQPHIPEWAKWVLAGIGVLLPSLSGASRVIEQPSLRVHCDDSGKNDASDAGS